MLPRPCLPPVVAGRPEELLRRAARTCRADAVRVNISTPGIEGRARRQPHCAMPGDPQQASTIKGRVGAQHAGRAPGRIAHGPKFRDRGIHRAGTYPYRPAGGTGGWIGTRIFRIITARRSILNLVPKLGTGTRDLFKYHVAFTFTGTGTIKLNLVACYAT
eukprot:SAG31_NODE_300_length_18109_cov_47.887285_3_plen_161_part_00